MEGTQMKIFNFLVYLPLTPTRTIDPPDTRKVSKL